MTDSTESTAAATQSLDDCPLPVSVQNRNICCFVVFWSVYYLAAPVSYVGLTHANLLKALGNDDEICNYPQAAYLWMTALPILAAWFLPQVRYLKPLALSAIALMASITAAVAATLAGGATSAMATNVVIAHGAVFGACNGILLTAMWDFLRRGVSTSRRGKALGLTFGIGPLFACVGSLLQDALFGGKLLGGRSFGLTFPDNYMAMFGAVPPLLLIAAMAVALFRIPINTDASTAETPFREIIFGLRQFVNNRNVLFGVLLYVMVYSGGNAIFPNISLQAATVLGPDSNTLGIQSFLRFGFKAVAGVLLGLLLAAASPRATLLATTSILLVGVTWALSSSGWWYMLTFGIMGAGELFGAYFPNYITTASSKQYVRINMAYASVLSALTGFASVIFGAIAKKYGLVASIYVGDRILVLALLLICLMLSANPTPKEDIPHPPDAD